MNVRVLSRVLLLALCLALTQGSACSVVPEEIRLNHSVELGANANARIKEVNDVLDRGFDLGPETRQLMVDFNDTLEKGLKAGLDEPTGQRLDELLRQVEDGVKLGLTPETLARVDDLINQIDKAPDQWGDVGLEIVEALESSAGTVAGQMASEAKMLINEARYNSQQLVAYVGIEFRCNVDFLGARMNDTLDQFIGRRVVERLKAIITGEEPRPEKPIPWVCGILPDRVDLTRVGDKLYFKEGVITITGFNYVPSNLPKAYVTDEEGQRLEAVQLFPHLTSSYQIQLNLQQIDFSAMPPRSKVVFQWPNVDVTSAIAIMLPSEPATAELVIAASDVNVYMGPGTNYQRIGIALSGAKYPVTGKLENNTWWQIDYKEQKGWVSADQVTRNEIDVAVATDVPNLPKANFEATLGPLREVTFKDSSEGRPATWRWDFGDGGTTPEPNPTHVYAQDGTYMVKLTVSNDVGSHTLGKQVKVSTFGFRTPLPWTTPTPVPTPTPKPVKAEFRGDSLKGEVPHTVRFTDLSQNGPTSWLWTFGDGQTSTERNPTHVYQRPGTYEVKLRATGPTSVDEEVKTAYVTARRPGCHEPFRTSSVSEETDPAYCPPGHVLNGIECYGDNCDNMVLRCCPYRNGEDQSSNFEWSPWFSDETNSYTQGSGFVTGVDCDGDRCDNVQLLIMSSPYLKNTGVCSFIQEVSEEQGSEGAHCGDGWYVAGMRCTGNECDNVSLYCCQAE
jgi:PKD repeat protein